jgi:hypothetical protein
MRALSCLLLVLLALLLARDAAAAPRRGLRATQEVAVAVDPVGIVRSTTLSASAVVYSSPSRVALTRSLSPDAGSSVTLNFFCEFVRPLLSADVVLPPSLC